jgi:hypothetical protein
LWVDDVRVEAVDRPTVLAWADGIHKTMPALTNAAVNTVGTVPSAALARLRQGQPLSIVLFGDSISSDLDNAALDVQIERAFPGSRVSTVFVGRGGTGWIKYRYQIRERILPYQPQLAVLLAISNDSDYLATDLARLLGCVIGTSCGRPPWRRRRAIWTCCRSGRTTWRSRGCR